MAKSKAYLGRITQDYLLSQINISRKSESFATHKKHIADFDSLYQGDLHALFPDDTTIPDQPLVENKVKNATHDLARLASDAFGTPVFMREGETKAANTRAAVRASIADTLWQMGNGKDIERKLYMDLIATGIASVSVYFNSESEYPIFMRLDPRSMYPDVYNGKLRSMVYVENMKERIAAYQWPDLGLDASPDNDRQCLVVQYMDYEESVQCVATTNRAGNVQNVEIVSRWEHGLGCVPVAFKALDSADSSFHGLFDQLGGPLMIRNKTVFLLAEYLEQMVHAPWEARGVLNATEEPGPLTVYEHDQTIDTTFIRRTAPAAPAGAVFGLLNYMDSQESAEAIQPPARVGIVSQSIASGSFVASTQGSLSSVIKELQDTIAELRVQVNTISFKVDKKYLNHEKPLWRSIGNKSMYTPEDDMGMWYHHKITYGAAAGLNRGEADARVIQQLGAGLIDKETARSQIDYLDDVTVIQNRIDKEQLSSVLFQRFVTDPNTPVTAIAEAYSMMEKGKTLAEVVDAIQEQLRKAQEAAQAAQSGQGGPGGPGQLPGGETGAPGQTGAGSAPTSEGTPALPAGGPGQSAAPVQFAPPPLQQQIVRNPGA